MQDEHIFLPPILWIGDSRESSAQRVDDHFKELVYEFKEFKELKAALAGKTCICWLSGVEGCPSEFPGPSPLPVILAALHLPATRQCLGRAWLHSMETHPVEVWTWQSWAASCWSCWGMLGSNAKSLSWGRRPNVRLAATQIFSGSPKGAAAELAQKWPNVALGGGERDRKAGSGAHSQWNWRAVCVAFICM